ncbi:uncharacterized protein LOC117819383 [Notolabrus celidotus]|uniref:uncharacterized protein LOC117819383 n=1 Tax=Notolabrus celidotus TaxID=1203425 RepID=UPI0014906340|nr:uncharacterized protein LOC117819383 [Notolabrus celidotus]
MPRSAAKIQVDKRGRRSSAQVTTPSAEDGEVEVEVEVKDSVPGRLTKTQWTDQFQEDPCDLVGEIMEELLSKVMEGCFNVDLKRQLAPFSALWAKTYLTQIIEQQVLCLDEGDGPEEASRTEDSEPLPTISDNWAQGCVPVVKATTPRLNSTMQQEADIGQVSMQKEQSANQEYHATIQTSISPKQSEEHSSPRRPLTDECYKGFTPRPPPKMNRSKIRPVHLLSKPVQSKLLPPLSCSVVKRDVGGKGGERTHSVSSHVTGSFYRQKDHRAIPNLDPSCLPRHWIFPQYVIMDSNSPKPISKKPSKLSKFEPRTNEQQSECTEISLKLLSGSEDKSAKSQRRTKANIWLKKMSSSGYREDEFASSMPLRLDKMDLAKGVSILGSQTVDINYLKSNPPAQSTNLQPIQHDAALPLFSVDQVTTGRSPRVTSLVQLRNCEN